MLNFPLPAVPDPELRLTRLGYPVFTQLCNFLDQGNHCNTLLNYLTTRLPELATHQPSLNGERLLRLLQNLNGSVGDLDFMLEQCSLDEALYLFREQVPVAVIQQPIADILVDHLHPVTLSFDVSDGAFPFPQFQWYFQPLTGNEVQLDGEVFSSITIPSVRTSNVGSYSCRITQRCRDGSFLTITTRSTTLSIAPFGPVISTPPEDHLATINDVVELRCVAEAYPPPTFQWCKDDQPIPNETDSTLLIKCESVQNSGRYSCLVVNLVGTVVTRDASVVVKIVEPLRIVHQPRFPNNAPVQVGAIIDLECRATGSLPVHYQWKCNGVELPDQTNPILRKEARPLNGNVLLNFQCKVSCLRTNEVIESDMATTEIDTSVSIQQHKASMKMALIIGNWAYQNMAGLEMVRADVKTLSDLLYGMNFDVVTLCNLSKSEIRAAVQQLCDLLLDNAYVVVYFAGHGIFYQRNYVMPVDVPSDKDYTLDDLISIDEIIGLIQRKRPKLLTFLLDTCRKIPQRDISNRADVASLDSRDNLVLGFATSENREAFEASGYRNGMFMTYLMREIEQPNVFIKTALNNLLRRFRQEIPDSLRNQIPQVTFTLAEDLSLHDPVDTTYVGTIAWNELYETYFRWTYLPSNRQETILWNGTSIAVSVEFSRLDGCFLNAIKIELIFNSSEEMLMLLPSVHPSSVEVLEVTQTLHRCSVSIHKLQALSAEDAVVTFSVAGSPEQPILTVNLGRPLISNCAARVYEPPNQF